MHKWTKKIWRKLKGETPEFLYTVSKYRWDFSNIILIIKIKKVDEYTIKQFTPTCINKFKKYRQKIVIPKSLYSILVDF